MKILLVVAELFHADGQTDTMKLIVAFRNVASETWEHWIEKHYHCCLNLLKIPDKYNRTKEHHLKHCPYLHVLPAAVLDGYR
jgi:hypothetical protein